MPKPLFFKIKQDVDVDKHHILELLFKVWIDNTCNNQVEMTIEKQLSNHTISPLYEDIFKVECELQEDATILKLQGIPKDLRPYLDQVNVK